MGIGAVSIPPMQALAILLDQAGLGAGVDVGQREATVLTAIRLPRVLATALVGAAWAVAGVAMQGLYRTPLADPALVGIGGGAALGAALGTALAVAWGLAADAGGTLLVVGVAAVMALLAAAAVRRVATSAGRASVPLMLLGGVVLSVFFGAVTALVVTAARSPELATIGFWSLGSFAGVVGRDVLVAALAVLPATAALARLGPRLDALALGAPTAGHLGVDVPRLAAMVTAVFVLLTAVAVASAGVIPFVALVAPALARTWLGPAHRGVVIGAALLGAMLLVLADVLARSLLSPVELPVGVVTTIIGAPVFLWLLLRDRSLLAR